MIPLENHTGETCVIIGNGPSLKSVPVDWLRHNITFGCNYINRLPFIPTYYTCIDSAVLNYNAGEIYTVASLAKNCFISNYPEPNMILNRLYALPNCIQVGKDTFTFATELYMSGNTATYVALKIAFFMGFTQALLVGVDHTIGEHFEPTYPRGLKTNAEGQRYHYLLAQTIWQENGREIINLSPPSLLDAIFKRGELTDYTEKRILI
jgi:hypothetical protein